MKNAIIFGATSGIGRELAILLAHNDYKVCIVGRRENLLNELVLTKPDKFIPLTCDLSEIENHPETLTTITNQIGKVDLVIISAGTGEINKDLDYPIEKTTNKLNVDSFTCLCDYFYNLFATQNSGHLVVITSVMGLRGSCAAPAYSASKAYQINYLEGLRQRATAQKKAVIITDIRPGSVNTDMMKGEGHFWISSPQKAANQIFSAIKRKKDVCYISRRWVIIGTLFKALPRFIFNKMGRV